eukprot:gene37187-42118_t
MQIGEIAAATGISRDTLRFYEKRGLLRARRSANGYRDYPPEAVDWLRYIRTAQQLGFSLKEIEADLPLLAAPFRALIGHKSDTHKSALGWRRVPYIYIGTMVQFGGLAIMPFALLVLAGAQEAYDERIWLGQPAAAL